MKIFTQGVYILCRNVKICAAASEHKFYVEDCAAVSERECAADIFFCVCGCFWKHFNVF